MAEPPVTFAGLLRQLRGQARLTQEELAAASESSPRTISDLERGVAVAPQRDTVKRLADALNLTGQARTGFEAAARGRPVPAGGFPAGSVVAGNVPQAPPAFQLRDELLSQLRGAGPGVSVIRAVTGMRGVGKTQLAAAYARDRQEAGWRLIAWVSAEDTPGLLGGLAVVADRLGIDRSGKTLEEIGGEVRNRLEADGDRCLIVFDNVTDFELVRPYVPALGAPQAVLTSTEAAVAGAGRAVSVGVFSEDEALAFLAARTGLGDQSGARALAAELGCLPLALAQAAAVMAAQHLSYPVYLARLRAHRAGKYLPPVKGDPYPHGAAEAILLSVEAVTAGDPTGLCGDLLGVASLLSAEGVSRGILYLGESAGAWPANEEAVDEALARLADASLLTFSGDDSVLAHRMVMRVLRERALYGDALPALAAKTAQLLGAFRKSLGEPSQFWQHRTQARECVRQVTALADHLAMHSVEEDPEPLLTLRAEAMETLFALGEGPVQAIEIGEKLVPDCERALGAAHRTTLGARSNLAYGYLSTGRLREATPLLQAVVADSERVLGAANPETQSARNNLALAYLRMDRVAEATPLFEAVLADSEQVLGTAHPDTLVSRNNLARAYSAAGRMDEAIELMRAALADSERVLGAESPETLRVRNNLAIAYRDVGRLDEAVGLLESVLTDRERLLGSAHPDTLASRYSVARARLALGRRDEAVALLEGVLADCQRVLGTTHSTTLAARHGLALANLEAGRLDAALPLFEQALAEMEAVLGADHPRTAEVRADLDRARQR